MANLLRRCTANLRCPFRRLRSAVIGAKHVVFEVALRVFAFGHMVGVKADGVLVQVFPVDEVLFGIHFKHGVRHTQVQRHVGRGTTRNPFGIYQVVRIVVEGVDAHNLGTVFPDAVKETRRITHRSPSRVATEHEQHVAVEHIQAVVHARHGVLGNTHHTGGVRPRAKRRRAPMFNVAAVQGQELGYRSRADIERLQTIGEKSLRCRVRPRYAWFLQR